jgi:hypothetical protein
MPERPLIIEKYLWYGFDGFISERVTRVLQGLGITQAGIITSTPTYLDRAQGVMEFMLQHARNAS